MVIFFREDMGKLSILCLLAVILALGCSAGYRDFSLESRIKTKDDLILAVGWGAREFKTKEFEISGFGPGGYRAENRVFAVYIEGDGLSWVSRSKVSPDPTPVNPLGLKLAMAHPDNAVIYLARPFQFIGSRNVDLSADSNIKFNSNGRSKYWTFARFAPEIIDAYGQILDQLKGEFGIQSFHLVGYSGGGAIAALIAAKRDDVGFLITLAGNLDHGTWTRHHGVSSLTGSLNPVDFSRHLGDTPQVHFYGENDTIVPREVLISFADDFPRGNRPLILPLESADHVKGWEEAWPGLYRRALGLYSSQ